MDALNVLPLKKGPDLRIKSENGLCILPLHTISVVEYGEHHVTLYCVNGKTIKSKTLRIAFQDWMRPLLAYENFISPHKSYIVNMNHVSFIQNDSTFLMKTGQVVPIAHRSFAQIRKTCLDYCKKNHLLV